MNDKRRRCAWVEREGKGREGKGREGKGRKGKDEKWTVKNYN